MHFLFLNNNNNKNPIYKAPKALASEALWRSSAWQRSWPTFTDSGTLQSFPRLHTNHV